MTPQPQMQMQAQSQSQSHPHPHPSSHSYSQSLSLAHTHSQRQSHSRAGSATTISASSSGASFSSSSTAYSSSLLSSSSERSSSDSDHPPHLTFLSPPPVPRKKPSTNFTHEDQMQIVDRMYWDEIDRAKTGPQSCWTREPAVGDGDEHRGLVAYFVNRLIGLDLDTQLVRLPADLHLRVAR